MSYLLIRNPGIADYRAFTILGISTSNEDTIGQFGSGSKYALALLLRLEIKVIIFCGNLKMEFYTKEIWVKNQLFRQVCVKYSGKDVNGQTNNRTEDLGFTLEWGISDWTKADMAFREFVSNAIDGCIHANISYKNVQLEVVDKPRAKANHTSVFIEYTDVIKKIHNQIDEMFLHFRQSDCIQQTCLNKTNEDYTLIYKKGVLVAKLKEKSVFNYNLTNLRLDESRNASESTVQYAVSTALRDESSDNLSAIISGIIKNENTWEDRFSSYDLRSDFHSTSEKVLEKRKKVFQEAWLKATGPNAIISNGSVDDCIRRKGFIPIHIEGGWATALAHYGVLTQTNILDSNEINGKIIGEPTQEMIQILNKVWNLLEKHRLTSNKSIPEVKAFTSIMSAGSQTLGYYLPGESKIYLHSSLGGKMMFKVCLEECIHYITQATDNSRDFQDFLFNLITEMNYGS